MHHSPSSPCVISNKGCARCSNGLFSLVRRHGKVLTRRCGRSERSCPSAIRSPQVLAGEYSEPRWSLRSSIIYSRRAYCLHDETLMKMSNLTMLSASDLKASWPIGLGLRAASELTLAENEPTPEQTWTRPCLKDTFDPTSLHRYARDHLTLLL